MDSIFQMENAMSVVKIAKLVQSNSVQNVWKIMIQFWQKVQQRKNFVLDNVYIRVHNVHKENLLNARIVMQDII